MTDCVCHEINSRNCPVHQNAHEVNMSDDFDEIKYLWEQRQNYYPFTQVIQVSSNTKFNLLSKKYESIDLVQTLINMYDALKKDNDKLQSYLKLAVSELEKYVTFYDQDSDSNGREILNKLKSMAGEA